MISRPGPSSQRADALLTWLGELLDDAAAPRGPLCVAYSGGADSTALLHALANLPQARDRGLRALHVDHGLHAESHRWAEHCQAQCATWKVACQVLPVGVDSVGQGLEAAAREARYAAFSTQLRAGETLLLAHHRDDQVETVLLKLLRGAGPEGLAGMRQRRPLGRAQLWRPLLTTPRQALRDYAQRHGLSHIEDPSNADTRLSRNHLRHEILPRLLAQWPHAADSILHSARLSRDADDALRPQWLDAYARLHAAHEGSLDAAGWLALPSGLRAPVLDHWLRQQGLPVPTYVQRQQMERQQHQAAADRLPCVRWRGTEVHLWRGRWWATPSLPRPSPQWQQPWQGQPLALPGGGRLSLLSRRTSGAASPTTTLTPDLPPGLTVRLRRGGERLKPLGHAHTRELRDLFQSDALPPWLRPLCPLIYEGEQLIAVADRWLTARARELFDLAGEPLWQPLAIDSEAHVQ